MAQIENQITSLQENMEAIRNGIKSRKQPSPRERSNKINREDPYRMSADAKRAIIKRRGKILDIRDVSKKGSKEPRQNTH